jgi:hypothetical protein
MLALEPVKPRNGAPPRETARLRHAAKVPGPHSQGHSSNRGALRPDANLRGTAFGPVNAQMHQVNVAVALGDAGTAIDLARRIDLRAVPVTERKASLHIDVARAFFQWASTGRPTPRSAKDSAPQEVAARPSVGTLACDLATLAPASIRRGRRAVRHPDRRPEVTPARRVLTLVACGASPAAAITTCVNLAQDRAWTVQVTATPAALHFFGAAAVADQAGSPIRSQYARPGAPRSLIPDAILVAPATYNTICKWAQGISDTYALGVLAETTGLGVPTVVLPIVDTALAGRAPFRRSVESRRRRRHDSPRPRRHPAPPAPHRRGPGRHFPLAPRPR